MKNQAKEPMMETKEKVNEKAESKKELQKSEESSFTAEKAESKKELQKSEESSFTAEKAVIVTGITATAVATGAVIVFYATAGVGVSAAIVLMLLDGASVILMGSLSTALAFYGVRLLKEIFQQTKTPQGV